VHIPDGIMSPPVLAVLAGVSAAGLGYAVRRANRELDEATVPLLGTMAAFVFAAQMVNFPIAAGTSAHFVGSALVGITLGPWAGLVVMAAVLLIQCFLFQDGGLTALGANFFNMGILGVGLAWGVHRLATAWLGPRAHIPAAFFAAWLASVVPAIACAVELGISGVFPIVPAATAMGGLHAVCGIAEAFVTVVALDFLRKVRPGAVYAAAATSPAPRAVPCADPQSRPGPSPAESSGNAP